MENILSRIRGAVRVEDAATGDNPGNDEDGAKAAVLPPFRLDRLALENWRIALLFTVFTGAVTGGAISLVNLGLQPYLLGESGVVYWVTRIGGQFAVLGAGVAVIHGLSRAFAASLDEDAFRPFIAAAAAEREVKGAGWFAFSYLVLATVSIVFIDRRMTGLLDVAVIEDLTDGFSYGLVFYGQFELTRLLKRFGRMRPADDTPAA